MSKDNKFVGYVIFGTCAIAILAAIIIPEVYSRQTFRTERNCVFTLKTLARCELSYMDSNLDRSYGSWEQLQYAGYIDEAYTPENIIQDYRIDKFEGGSGYMNIRFVYRPPMGSFNPSIGWEDTSFTIVAVPLERKNKLRTFGIHDDQRPYIWIGKDEDYEQHYGHMNTREYWIPVSWKRMRNREN